MTTARSLTEATGRTLDAARARWLSWAGRGRRKEVWDTFVALRPAWWVVRAWTTVQAVDLVVGGYPHSWLPSIPSQEVGALLWAVATVISVQIGRGRWWPGGRGGRDRLVLLALNSAAVVLTPFTAVEVSGSAPETDWMIDQIAYYEHGTFVDGRQVCNILPYDAQGRRLAGVQLVDQSGLPITARCEWGPRTDPWTRDSAPRWNVFPQALRSTGELPAGRAAVLPPVESPVASQAGQGADRTR